MIIMKGLHQELIWLVTVAALTLPGPSQADGAMLRGNVVWKYNDYVGYKADVGARVIVMKRDIPKSRNIVLISSGTGHQDGVFTAQVDLAGKFEFTDLPAGEYDVLVVSKATKRARGSVSVSDLFVDENLGRSRAQDDSVTSVLATEADSAWAQFRHASSQDEIARTKLALSRQTEFGNWYDLKWNFLAPHFEGETHAAIMAILMFPKYELKTVAVRKGHTEQLDIDFDVTY